MYKKIEKRKSAIKNKRKIKIKNWKEKTYLQEKFACKFYLLQITGNFQWTIDFFLNMSINKHLLQLDFIRIHISTSLHISQPNSAEKKQVFFKRKPCGYENTKPCGLISIKLQPIPFSFKASSTPQWFVNFSFSILIDSKGSD